jgi:serine/threonine protein kinase
MAEPVIPGLTRHSDGTYAIAAATIPATELTAGQTVSVNGVVYTLVKYLGGGTYGKVWSATDPFGAERSIKFVYVDYGVDTPDNIRYTKEATEAVINEARITKKLYDKTSSHPICSNIHGLGRAAGYIIIVMDIFEITLDWYLEHGGSAKEDELVWKLHEMLKRVNEYGMLTSHGDVKGDNFMIDGYGALRAVDFGFGHIKEGGLDIHCNDLNVNNIGINRDIVQFVIYLTLFYKSRISKRVANAVAPIIGKLATLKGTEEEFKGKSLWSIAYRYLNQTIYERDINAVARRIIELVRPLETQAAPFTLPEEEASVIEEPPLVTEEPLPTPTTIAASIEDKLTIKSLRKPTELMAAEEEARLEAMKAEEEARISGHKRRTIIGGARKSRKRNSKKKRKTRRRKTRTSSKMLK